jgi:DNA-binding winged helix-turn-helix (wHTH) protein/TolB-like protein/cytochrome c-type biogenesis protein CcmH/NrfG
MQQTPDPPQTLRFGDFELDVAGYRLRRKGRPVRIERQPMDLLILLVERRPHLVPRADIVDRLWGRDVFIDVETGVNTAISKVRQALRDSPDNPAFVERVPGKGYRFVATVEAVCGPSTMGVATDPELARVAKQETGVSIATDGAPPFRAAAFNLTRLTIGVVVVLIVGFATWSSLHQGAVTLAVLPFASLGNDSDRAYLAAGLTDETTASLAEIDPEHLSVKGRTLGYKNTTKDLAALGRELSVDYLVDASIRLDAGDLHVTVTLSRVRDQQVWSKVYVREPANLLRLPREISADIARQVRGPASPERLRSIDRRQTQNNAALDLYFRARAFENRRNPEGTAHAVEQYTRALTLDPDYALAWVGLGSTYAASTVNSDADPREVGNLARHAAHEAIRINPDLPEAQRLDGYVKWLLDWNWPAAEVAFRRAIELDPSEAESTRSLGHALSQAGRRSEADIAMRRVRALEPLNAMSYALSSQVAFQAGEYSDAIGFARDAIRLGPDFWIGYMQIGQAYQQMGESLVALEALTDAARLSHGNSKAISLRGYILANTGRRDEAREVLRTLEHPVDSHYVPPYAMALVDLGLDDRDATFAALEHAYAIRDVHLIYLPVDAKWDPYRTDVRFAALLAKCGFPASR